MEEQKVFISPKIDFSFKEIMKREKAVKSFLSAVLKIQGKRWRKSRPLIPIWINGMKTISLASWTCGWCLTTKQRSILKCKSLPFPIGATGPCITIAGNSRIRPKKGINMLILSDACISASWILICLAKKKARSFIVHFICGKTKAGYCIQICWRFMC